VNTKRIVITGGPGSGKTTLINHIKRLGYSTMEEVSREIINEARKEGIDQLFLTDPMLFSQKLLESRLLQFEKAKELDTDYVFYDRATPDITAYMDFIGSQYSAEFEKPCYTHLYDCVFLLPPWELIYTKDNERYETFTQAKKIYKSLCDGYKKYGYTIIEVPQASIEQRWDFISNYLKKIY
jgi:predicted ATPase